LQIPNGWAVDVYNGISGLHVRHAGNPIVGDVQNNNKSYEEYASKLNPKDKNGIGQQIKIDNINITFGKDPSKLPSVLQRNWATVAKELVPDIMFPIGALDRLQKIDEEVNNGMGSNSSNGGDKIDTVYKKVHSNNEIYWKYTIFSNGDSIGGKSYTGPKK